MSKIQIGRRSTKAIEFIESNTIFMNSEGNFVAGEFVEISTPNISKLFKTDKHFETFEIIESERPVPPETRVVAKFNVTDTASPKRIVSTSQDGVFSSIEIDGVEQPSIVSLYTFDTLGEHTVKYTLTDETSIGNSAFKDCSLISIDIPNSVTSIGDEAFQRCYDLTSIDIPNSVTSIGEGAFSDCTNLTSITIPNSITTISSRLFEYCDDLTSIDIPNSVTSIENYAFVECHELTSIDIPNSVTSIGEGAFFNCTSLASITIPNSVTSIGSSSFAECYPLTSCTIGNSVTSIGDEAFTSCYTLANITCLPTTPPALGESVFVSSVEGVDGRKIYVPLQSVNAYKAASGWSDYASDILPIP